MTLIVLLLDDHAGMASCRDMPQSQDSALILNLASRLDKLEKESKITIKKRNEEIDRLFRIIEEKDKLENWKNMLKKFKQ